MRGRPRSLLRQAELLDGIVGHCLMRGGAPADEALITITRDEAGELQALVRCLWHMAPYENEIRRLVAGS
ncbi:hypothetical protein EFQ99_31490 [Rhizobium vallis]|uniref:Uncharacterized protein n=1 Tax=Rhizobium vallis TaxID=634290 RepID=A0A3S0R5F1_9HYPH|nr:hypothetical protein [Rhizobium vallis]RUM19293.1 hypothetical protein EFQ99_31490 [Rhizobium vallis]